jgi:hypothetical protein
LVIAACIPAHRAMKQNIKADVIAALRKAR